jgi:hypothetical protein
MVLAVGDGRSLRAKLADTKLGQAIQSRRGGYALAV